ncbi:MAG: hypothetical protein Q8O58_10890 [Gallionella sp.]|nr:hypothetical protein [Gallionella sp.]
MSGAYITIGETRIKKSNIKTFGISHQNVPAQKLINAERILNGIQGVFGGGSFSDEFSRNPPSQRGKRYLFVTTYQNDNYQFFENEINIEDAVKVLEEG